MNINLTEVTGITIDSRQVKPGFIFVAIKGALQDGHDYIKQAITAGAKIIVHQSEVNPEPGVQYLQSKDPRVTLAELAHLIYPKQPKNILGVTGTSGKSSIVHFVREILKSMNKKAVSIGTLGILGDLQLKSNLTTPSTIEMQQILNQIAEAHIEYTAIECSSHGIDQHRLDQVNFTACAFTNLSHDHLDYHNSMEEYFQVKKQLFSLMKHGYAVLNSDIKEFLELKNYCLKQQHKVITYGKKNANITIQEIKQIDLDQEVTWNIDQKTYQTKISLIGEFQIYNLACAIGLLLSSGIEVDNIMPLLEKIKPVTGRMEMVAQHNEAGVFVDYSHKPDALSHALKTLKSATNNYLWVIFGCGGGRDQSKRPEMGKIACQYADNIIITDDNPRSETPESIRKSILSGCNANAKEISGRAEAIAYALNHLQPGDNLLIAGKGHENYQIIGKETIHFSDNEKVKEIIKSTSMDII
jgi:UDP-N-acetylmuramoyl-L-alanyl-D-glutamate--2,6-diaminopimelate ligase